MKDGIKESILKVVSKEQPITYTKLSKETGFSIWTISDLIKILQKENKILVKNFAGAKLVKIKNGE